MGRVKAERRGSFDWTFGLELKRAATLVTLNKRLIMQNVPSSEIRERDRVIIIFPRQRLLRIRVNITGKAHT